MDCYVLHLLNLWSGRRESDPRPTAWKAVTLPLSYSRLLTYLCPHLRSLPLQGQDLGGRLPTSTRHMADSTFHCRPRALFPILELMTGIEPVTSPLPRECSTN